MLAYPRSLLMCLPPEAAHRLLIRALPWLARAYAVSKSQAMHPVECGGLTLRNAVGLAAGVDKHAECVDAWAAMGFGFVEVGTVTHLPQQGNPKPRVFRLPKHQAIINRYGFNSHGAKIVAKRLAKRRSSGVVGVNIGKNKHIPLGQAVDNYVACFNAVAPQADYVTVNVSSPNTPGLRELQERAWLTQLLDGLCDARMTWVQRSQKTCPLWLKCSPDMTEDTLMALLDVVRAYPIDALVLSNTTLSRLNVCDAKAQESGGLSGLPLRAASLRLLKTVRSVLPGMSLVGVGGILSAADAIEKKVNGADAVQLYTGLIYQGPALLRDILRAW